MLTTSFFHGHCLAQCVMSPVDLTVSAPVVGCGLCGIRHSSLLSSVPSEQNRILWAQ